MRVGIKAGPANWQKILPQVEPECCEIWFRIDWKKRYIPLFKYLNKRKIPFGLHFWAMIDNKYFPDMLCLKKGLGEKTFQLIKETIDIASIWQAEYVNFHPESYHLNLLDLDKHQIKTLNPDEPIDKEKSFQQLLFYLKKIKKYSEKKGVTPFLETVPKYMPSDFKNLDKGRRKVAKSEGLETEKFFELAELNYPVCLDLGHTIGQLISNDKEQLFSYLYTTTKKLKPVIGLIHVTTNKAPFNGTDSHNGVLEKDFNQGVVPDKKQLIKLLSLFKDKDVCLIPEPRIEDMVENHRVLKEIVKKI